MSDKTKKSDQDELSIKLLKSVIELYSQQESIKIEYKAIKKDSQLKQNTVNL